MTDLTKKPYCLKEEDIAWVENTIRGMSDEEKVGQLFFQLTSSHEEAHLKELMEKYHLGGCRYNPAPGANIAGQNRLLQKYAKIPVFIACNTEAGGDGACKDGTHIGCGVKVAATDKEEYAYQLGRLSNTEAKAIGCNMAFAPVSDILYNWENTEVVSRAFGRDPERVARMSLAYMKGVQDVGGFAATAKHFPGNGQDFRDAHISNNVNYFDRKTWEETYGLVYRTLIENGLDAIMAGHIMLPKVVREMRPEITDEEMMPATLSYDIMTTLLRDELGFNGMVVTDASHMVGMTDRMKRKDMLPLSIVAGCDMFLFFNDPEEDFETMLNAYREGIIPEGRMEEALRRILGLKAKLGLHKMPKEALVPSDEEREEIFRREEAKKVQEEISRDAITLVKYKDKDVLPITPERYKRIMIVHIKGAENAMQIIMKGLGGAGGGGNCAERLRDRLIEKGFDAFIYESPLDRMKKQMEEGIKPDLNVYFAGKNAIRDFVKDMDLVITLCDVKGRPSFGLSKGGGEIPWYVFELPVVVVGCDQPTMLADIPQARTYINTYDSKDSTFDALVEKLMEGESAFTGVDPIDSFCGLFDAKI